MTRVDPEIEQLAQQRLVRDEARITGAGRRTSRTLAQVGREFWRHPSPYLISACLISAVTARVAVGGGSWWELTIPGGLLALFPVIEWLIHVVILHWRPRTVAGLTIDPLLARKHREHHADPRELPLVFIPWQAQLWLAPAWTLVAWVTTPTWSSMLTLLVSIYAIKAGYEWTHYLVHSDYRPRSRWFRAVWRNHRLHHYKNEHYWFTVTTSGTADRLFGTCPDPADVPTSPTVRALHAASSES